MRRLWLRWIALVVFVAVLGTVFVNLGEWQLRRLTERRAHNAIVIANEAKPVVPLAEVFGHGPITGAEQWRRVRVTGTFDPDHQYVVRYRSNGDDNGYEVVTPLRTADGATVLVDRGFVAVPGGQSIPDTAPTPPAGTVTVVGHARVDETGRTSATVPVEGQVRLVDSAAIAPTLPYPILDGYVGLLSSSPAETGFQVVQPPELSDGPHFWYAVQWFMFTGIGVLGIVVFIRADLRERRAARAEAAAASPPPPPPHDVDQPEPVPTGR